MRVRDAIAVAAAALGFAEMAAGQDDDAPKGPLTRVVTVVAAEDRKPLAGATVDAVGLPTGTVTKTTGTDGVAKFPDMPRRGVTFVARAADRFPGWHEPGGFSWARSEEDDDGDGDGVTSMTFGLAKGSVFEGDVVAKDDGAPIAGATVVAEQEAEATDQFELDVAPTWAVVTDTKGRFRTQSHFPADFPPAFVHMRITVRAPGWISEHLDVKPGDSDIRESGVGRLIPQFSLRRAARLRGTVKDAGGTPVAGAIVHACPPGCGVFHGRTADTMRDDEDAHPRVLHAVTDAQGRYDMPEFHPGVKFFVYAERKEQEPSHVIKWEEPVARSDVAEGVGTEKAGEETVCDLKLHALASLAVRVAADAGGDAEHVSYELSSGPPHAYPSIDREEIDGGTKFVRLDPGTYTLRVRAKGWLTLQRTVDVPAGEHVELTVRLEKGTRLGGVAVDDLGAPVAGVVVYAYPVDPSTGRLVAGEGHSASSDAAGKFRIEGLPPGPVDVDARDDDHVPGDYVRIAAPSSDVRLVLVRRPFITLRVDAPDGAPLPAKIRTTVKALDGRYAGMRDPMTVPAADLPAKLDRLRPGPVDVTVDIVSCAASTLHVELKPGETTAVGPFAFVSGVTLAGRVVDASGRAVASARVTPYENDARTATTAEDGSFALPHLAPGATEICVVADGFPETRLVATAAEDGAAADVVLRPGGVVRGVVTSRDAGHLYDRQLCIYDASAPDGYGPHWHGKIGKDPHFSLRLPAGKYRFVPSRYEFTEGAVVFEVTEGGTTDVAFELP